MNRRPSPPHDLEALESRVFLDAAEPTANDQYMLELINWVRAHPSAAASSYGIDLNEGVAQSQAISTAAKQPLAFNPNLLSSALSHNLWMLTPPQLYQQVEFDGKTPAERMKAAGYPLTDLGNAGENIAYVGVDPPNTLTMSGGMQWLMQSLFIDGDTTGRSRRLNLMDDHFTEVGIAVSPASFQGQNAMLLTQDLVMSGGNSFLTGVVYQDRGDKDHFYTPGEGMGGLTVTATPVGVQHEPYTVTTWTSGGYSLQVPDGTYDLAFSGGDLDQSFYVPNVVVDGANVEEDLNIASPPPQTDLKATTPAHKTIYVRPGETFDFDAVITNAGKLAATQSFAGSVYLSSSSTVTASDTQLATYDVASLKGGKSNKAQLTLTAPSQDGTYYLSLLADDGNAVNESNEDNNWSNVVTLVVGEPNLTAEIVTCNFAGKIVPGDKGTIKFKLDNIGAIPASGAIQVEIWATASAGTPQDGDVKLLTLPAKNVNVAPDGSATITAKLTLSDALPQGDWHFTIVADSANSLTESDETDNVVSTAETRQLVWQFGSFDGRKNVKLIVHDAQQNPVSFSLSDGWGEVLGGADFSDVLLHDTTANSNFTAAVPRNARSSVGNLSVPGQMGSINASSVDVRGKVDIAGGISSLTLGNMDNATDQQLLLHSDPSLQVAAKLQAAVSLGTVRNLLLDANHMNLRSLSVVDWKDDGGVADTLASGSIGSISVKGRSATKTAPKIAGDLAAVVTVDHAIGSVTVAGDVSGAWLADSVKSLKIGGNLSGDLTLDLPLDTKTSDLGSLSVGGWIQNSRIRSSGSIGTVVAGGIESALIFAGVDLAATALPASFVAQAKIGSIAIKGSVADGGKSVIHPLISAYALGSVSLCYAAPAAGTAWGIVTHSIAKFSYKSDGLTYSWPNQSDTQPLLPADMTMTIL